MSNSNYMHQRIQQLEELLRQLQNKTESIETTLSTLKTELAQLKQEPRTIEYNFDQLKIDTLEGTLNIGLSPGGSGLENIDEFTINGNPPDIGQQSGAGDAYYNDFYQWMNQCVERYLNEDIYSDIKQVEQKMNYFVDPSRHKAIVDDIKQQMGMRLPHYVMAAKHEEARANPHQEVDRIMNQIKKDIMSGIEIYLNQERQKSQGGNQNGT
ncbi:spore germination protein GerPC [Alkalihalobacillus sp. AL-G]|uniref:spore germination protein GerPC n=1 Tax=Alkalihalobacillus sp. AL-G TaxID=2926399 RepID=UPI002729AA97|nr:spore germination protein GerPC [Alkalihalobacillus sp. AL-G]WLD91591.1 spore germination protein GerPC [Alkalihalobacillus sp. AL-G]